MRGVKGSKLFNLVVALTVMVLLAATPVFADVVGKISFLNGRVDILQQGQNEKQSKEGVVEGRYP